MIKPCGFKYTVVLPGISRLLILIVFILLGFSTSSFAQGSQKGIPFVKNYLPADYDGESQNWAIAQDNRGVMYFGNTAGLLEFDGAYWRNVDPVNIYVAKKDSHGTIFVAGKQDLGYLQINPLGKTIFKSLKPLLPDSLKELKNFYTIAIGPNRVFFGERGGRLHIYDYNRIKTVPIPVKSMHLVYINNQLFIAGNEGLFKLSENNKAEPVPNTKQLKGVNTQELFWFNQKLLLVTRLNGLYTYNGHEAKPWITEATPFLMKNQVYRATLIDNNQIAFGTVENGVLIMDAKGKPIQHVNNQGGMVNHDHCAIFTDNTGNIWSGLEHGISHIQVNSPFTFFNKQNGLNNSAIYAIEILKNKLYVGTAQGVMYRSFYPDDHPLTKNWQFNLIQENKGRKAWDFYIDNNQLLTGSSNLGIYAIKNNKATKLVQKNVPLKMIADKSGNFIVGSRQHGGIVVLKKINNTWKLHRVFHEAYQIDYIARDSSNRFWAYITKHGLAQIKFSPDFNSITHFKVYTPASGLPKTEVLPFNLFNKICFATPKGTYAFNDKTNTFIPDAWFKNLENLYIHEVINPFHNHSYFLAWLNGHDVFVHAHKSNRASLPEFKVIDRPFKKLKNLEIKSLFALDTAHFLIGGVDRLLHFDQNKLDEKMLGFNTLIREVEIVSNNDSLLFAGPQPGLYYNKNIPELKFKHNALRFKYVAVFFDDPEQTRYSYKLEGYDKIWSAWNPRNEKEYSYLKKGEYTFLVKAKNMYGEESDAAEFRFIVNPPWYATIWAWITYFIALLIITRLVIVFSVQRIKREKTKLEQLVNERTKQLAMQRDQILQKNKTLEQQKEALSFQHQELTDHRKKILASIEYAKQIQSSLLPRQAKFKELFDDYFILYKPKDIVSGDFYWLHQVNGCTILAAADCTGHGVPGAFMSIMGISLLNDIVRKKEVSNTAQVLEELRVQVKLALNQNIDFTNKKDYLNQYLSNSVKDGIDIALISIDNRTLELTYSGANLPAFVLRQGKLHKLEPTDNPIGIYLKEIPFEQNTYQLQKGDIIYLFSDGYYDQFGGPNNQKFLMDNFIKLLIANAHKPLNEQEQLFHTAIENWQGINDQIDDMLVMAVRI